MAHWTMDLSKYAEKKKVEIKEVRKAYAFALYSSIVKKTPFDTGRAKANWNVSVGAPELTTTEETRRTPKPKDTMPDSQGDESIFISNNLPYIATLEYGGFPNPPKKDGGKTVNGFSKKAPEGMVGVTLANNEAIFEAAVRAVRGNK